MRYYKTTLVVTVALAGVLAGCVSQNKYDTLASKLRTTEGVLASREARIKKLDKEIAELSAALVRTKKELAEVRRTLSADLASKEAMLEKQKAALEARMAELMKTRAALEELDRIKAEMARQKELNDRLTRQFRKMISAGQLKLVNRRGRLVIQLQSKILFPSGKAAFTKAGKSTLTELAAILKNIDQHFQVAGHTDNIPMKGGRYSDNWALSGHRATVVVRLLQQAGVPGHRLSAAGFGEFDPLKSNDTEDGKAENRRIEITLLPSIPPPK